MDKKTDIFSFFIKNKKFTMILTLMVALFGLNGLKRLASEAFPNVNLGAVKITTFYDGAASDIELKITKPIEEGLGQWLDLKKFYPYPNLDLVQSQHSLTSISTMRMKWSLSYKEQLTLLIPYLKT